MFASFNVFFSYPLKSRPFKSAERIMGSKDEFV
jgi:hypothetical protein